MLEIKEFHLIQYLVFTGVDGSIFDPNSVPLLEVQRALTLLAESNIPLILTSQRTESEILPITKNLHHSFPFIVENGGGIYIPKGNFKTGLGYSANRRGYQIIELGLGRNQIREKLRYLRAKCGYKIFGFSELEPQQLAEIEGVHPSEFNTAKKRRYTESSVFYGDIESLKLLYTELENMNLRLVPMGNHFLLTGDHDTGSAVRYLVQLYREEYPEREIKTMGLGDCSSDGPMLYAVDQPVLVRSQDGSFDGNIGRRGIKFTRSSGALGWSSAVIALLTEQEEA